MANAEKVKPSNLSDEQTIALQAEEETKLAMPQPIACPILCGVRKQGRRN